MRFFLLKGLRRILAKRKKYPECPPLSATKKEIGAFGECYTVIYLEKQGYTIRERNLRLHKHELDIVAEKDNMIIFCEVKTRYYAPNWLETYGRPAQGITKDQISNIRHAAASYIKRVRGNYSFRFDVAEVYLTQGDKNFKIEKFNYIETAYR